MAITPTNPQWRMNVDDDNYRMNIGKPVSFAPQDTSDDPAVPVSGDPSVPVAEDSAPVSEPPTLNLEGLSNLYGMYYQRTGELLPLGELKDPGFFSAFGENVGWKMVPFLGAAVEMNKMADMYYAAKRIEDEQGTQEDQDLIMDWFLEQQIKQYQNRGIRSNAGSIASESLPFLIEFLATQGVYTAGKKAMLATIQGVLKKQMKAGVSRKIVRKTATTAAGIAAQTGAMGITGRFRKGAYQEMLPELNLDYDDEQKYHAIVTAPGRPETEAWFRSVVDYYIEVASERSGWMLARGVAKPFNAIASRNAHVNSIKNKIVELYGKKKNIRGKKLVNEVDGILKQAGWNGILGEIFEERVGAVARLGFDVMTGEEVAWELEQLAERLGFTQEQFYTELLAFSAFQGGMMAPAKGIDIVSGISEKRSLAKKGRETIALADRIVAETELEEGVRSALGDAATEEQADAPQHGVKVKRDGVEVVVPVEDQSAEKTAIAALEELAEENGWEVESAPSKRTIKLVETVDGTEKTERMEDVTPENFEEKKAEFEEAAKESDELSVVVERPLDEKRKDTFKFRGLGAETDNVEETVETIQGKEREATGNEDVTVEVVPESEYSSDTASVANTLKKRGINVVVVRGSEGRLQGAQGAYQNRTVYIQDIGTFEEASDSKEAARELFLGVLTHELTHHLERENPNLYMWILDNMPDRFMRGIVKYERDSGEKLSLQDAISEGGAVLMQELVTTLGGKKMLNMQDRGMIEKFVDWIRYHATKLGIRGKKLKELQEVVEAMLTGDAYALETFEAEAAGVEEAVEEEAVEEEETVEEEEEAVEEEETVEEEEAEAVEPGEQMPLFAAPLTAQEESDVQFAFNNPFPHEQLDGSHFTRQSLVDWFNEEAKRVGVTTDLFSKPIIYGFDTTDGRVFDVEFDYSYRTYLDSAERLLVTEMEFSEEVSATGMVGAGTDISDTNKDTARVFATVLKTAEDMQNQVNPDVVMFTASVGPAKGKEGAPSDSRIRLYDALLKRFAGEAGYDVYKERIKRGAGYTLVKPALELNVAGEKLVDAQPQFAASPKEVASKIDARADRKRDLFNDTDYQELVERGAKEINEALDGKSELGRGWYTRDFRRALYLGSLIEPSIKASKKNVKLFVALLAVTSPNQKLALNYKLAVRAFQHYSKTGTVGHSRKHNVKPGGAAGPNIFNSLKQLNLMVQDMGIDAATNWLFTKHVGYELAEMRKKYGVYKGGNAALTKEHYGIRIFGGKVGPFGLNFAGVAEEVTIDVWASRTVARWLGVLGAKSKEFIIGDTGIVENVKNEGVRNKSKQLFRDIGERVGLEPQDAQAVLWYYEKRLFANEGYAAAGEDINLESSAKQLVQQDIGDRYEEGKIETDFKRAIRLADAATLRRQQEPSGRLRERDTSEPQFAAGTQRETTPEDPRGLGSLTSSIVKAIGPEKLIESQDLQFAAAPEKGSAEEARIFKNAYKGGVVVHHGTIAKQMFWDFETKMQLGSHFGTSQAAYDRLTTLVNTTKMDFAGADLSPDVNFEDFKQAYARVYKAKLNIKNPLRMEDANDFNDILKVFPALLEAEKNPENNLPNGFDWGRYKNSGGFWFFTQDMLSKTEDKSYEIETTKWVIVDYDENGDSIEDEVEDPEGVQRLQKLWADTYLEIGSLVQDLLMSNGFDSIVYKNEIEDMYAQKDSYIVFNSEDIYVKDVYMLYEGLVTDSYGDTYFRQSEGPTPYGKTPPVFSQQPQYAAGTRRETTTEDPRGIGRGAAVALRILSPNELERSPELQFAAAPEKGSAEEARIFDGAYKGGVRVSHGTVAKQIFWDFSTDYEMGAHFGTPLSAEERMNWLYENRPSLFREGNDKYLRVYDVRLNIKNPIKLSDAGLWYDSGRLMRVLKEGAAYVENNLPGAEYNYGPYKSMEGFEDYLQRVQYEAIKSRKDSDSYPVLASTVREFLELNGFDSIVYRNEHEDAGSDSYIVFNPENIFVEEVRRYKVQGGALLETGETIEYGAPQFAAPISFEAEYEPTLRALTTKGSGYITFKSLTPAEWRWWKEELNTNSNYLEKYYGIWIGQNALEFNRSESSPNMYGVEELIDELMALTPKERGKVPPSFQPDFNIKEGSRYPFVNKILPVQPSKTEAQPQFAAAPSGTTTAGVKKTARQLAKDMYNKWLLKHKAKEEALEERRDALKIVVDSLEKAYYITLPKSIQRLEWVTSEAKLQEAIQKIDEYVAKVERKESASKFKKIVKKLNPKRFDPAFWKMIVDIVGDIDITKPTKKTKENLTKIVNFIKDVKTNPDKYSEEAVKEVELYEYINSKALSRLGKKSLADMSKEEIDEAIAAIELIRTLNRLNNELILHQKSVKRAATIQQVHEELTNAAGGKMSYTRARRRGARAGTVATPTHLERIWDILKTVTGLKMSQQLQPDAMAHLISGSPNSTTWDILYGSVDAAYASMLKDYYASKDYLIEVLKSVGVDTSTKEGRNILRSMSQSVSGKSTEWQAGEGRFGLPGRVEKVTVDLIEIELSDNRTLSVTEAELIDLLAHFQDMSTIKQIVENNSPIKLDITTTGRQNETDLSIKDIVSIMSFAEKEHSRAVTIADAMVTYANGPLAQLLEQWSVDTHGYSMISGDTWWSRPRQRSNEEIRSIASGELAIESMTRSGLVKERGEGTSAILVKDAFAKFSNMSWTISGISNLDPVIKSARSVLNSEEIKEFLETHKRGNDIRTYWRELYGEIATQVVGGQPDSGDAGQAMRFLANLFTKGTLALNPRVAAYQVVSVGAASAEMPGQHLPIATTTIASSSSARQETDEAMDRYSPYLRFRFDSSAYGLVNAVSSTGTSMYGVPQQGEWGMGMISFMDKQAIRTIWRGCESWVRADINSGKLVGVTENSQEFYEEVAKRAELVVKRTQPTMDPVHSSGLTKSARKFGGISRIYTMFASQRNKNVNLVVRGLLNEGSKVSNSKRIIATLVFQPTGLILINYVYELALRGGMAALWGDDEGNRKLKELNKKTFSKTILNKYLSINFGNLPVGSYLSDIAISTGVDVGLLEEDDSQFAPALPLVGELWKLVNSTQSAFGEFVSDDYDEDKFYAHVKRAVLSTGRLTGTQWTPLLSQAVQVHEGYMVEPDYTSMFNTKKRELKDIHVSERTPEQKRLLKSIEDYYSSDKLKDKRKEITDVKSIIKEEKNKLGFKNRSEAKQNQSRVRIKAAQTKQEKLEEQLNELIKKFVMNKMN